MGCCMGVRGLKTAAYGDGAPFKRGEGGMAPAALPPGTASAAAVTLVVGDGTLYNTGG